MVQSVPYFIKTTHRQDDIVSLNHVFTSGETLKVDYVNQFNHLLGGPNQTLLYNLVWPAKTG